MDSQQKVTYIDEADIRDKRVLVRVDFNVSLTSDGLSIADDARIKQSLPTLSYLLKHNNRLILVSHLGRPEGRDTKFSLRIVADHLKTLLPDYSVVLIDDFLSEEGRAQISQQQQNQIVLLENIRFYPQEQSLDQEFAQQLASLGDAYVNDAFGVSHRTDASVVGVPILLPSYGGLLLKKEIETLSKLLQNPQKPFVAIIGGAKISTKVSLLSKLIDIADHLLLGGGIANTFLFARGYKVGKSFIEEDQAESAVQTLRLSEQKQTQVVLPEDVVVGDPNNSENGGHVVKVESIPADSMILDIGPETQAKFGMIIQQAKTIVWNGPVGYIENPQFRRGTDFLYYSITQNPHALSIVGGGDTLVAISKKEYLDKITHISTGGGAMLEFIEKGTLPGIEALKKTEFSLA